MKDEIGRREFLKRGTMAGMIAATGLPIPDLATASPAQAMSAIEYAHAGLAERRLDSQAFCLSVYDSIAPAMHFSTVHGASAPTAASARAWQSRVRERLVERLGGFPATRVPLNAEVLEIQDFGSYTRERIAFDTREHLSAVGYLLLPKERPHPLPVILAFSGHGRGVDDILGIGADGSPLPQRGIGYAREYGLQCVEHGYATFAVEQLAFGARRDAAARKAGPTENSCRPAACAALLFGQTMIGWRA